jgi:hypothetical protein
VILFGAADAAYQLATSGTGQGETDELLADALWARANGNRRALARVLAKWPAIEEQESYRSDRVRRVLTALIENRKISPPPLHLRDLYAEEQALNELPRLEGLAKLIAIDPILADVVRRFQADAKPEPPLARREDQALRWKYVKELRLLVGPDSETEIPLLASPTALQVAAQALLELWPLERDAGGPQKH